MLNVPGHIFFTLKRHPTRPTSYRTSSSIRRDTEPLLHSTGDFLVGGKVNFLSEERDDSLGLGIRLYAEIGTETPEYNMTTTDSEWRQYAGVSGETDYGLDFLFSKELWITELLVNVGYKKIGDPDRGLRVQYVDSSQNTTEGFLVGEPVETKLNLHDHLIMTGGHRPPRFQDQRPPAMAHG